MHRSGRWEWARLPDPAFRRGPDRQASALPACVKINRMVVEKAARPMMMLRFMMMLLGVQRSGDRDDWRGGADGDRGKEERADERESDTLGGFETERHGKFLRLVGAGPSSLPCRMNCMRRASFLTR
jgi:hypothetical protein